MTLISQGIRIRRTTRAHLLPIAASCIVALAAAVAVTYLLRPHFETEARDEDPARLPVSIGGTLFNVPTKAIRMKVQRHSGPQERVDLGFLYPSLNAPDAPRHYASDSVDDALPPIDRLFLSISAHHDALAPDVRFRTIYPHYLGDAAPPQQDGLTQRAFRDGSPYAGEDLFVAQSPAIVARCTRDGDTPGMCLAERRIGGADLTFRFPRAWLAQWRDVAGAIERLSAKVQSPRE